jgi:hypothetical protein
LRVDVLSNYASTTRSFRCLSLKAISNFRLAMKRKKVVGETM